MTRNACGGMSIRMCRGFGNISHPTFKYQVSDTELVRLEDFMCNISFLYYSNSMYPLSLKLPRSDLKENRIEVTCAFSFLGTVVSGCSKWLKKACDPEKDAYKVLCLSLSC